MPWAAKTLAERRGRRPSDWRSDPFYRTARWLRFRRWFLARNPLCADPQRYHAQDGQTVAATDVDHIVPIKRGGAKLDARNCQGLCHACHSRKTAQERR